MYKEEAKYPKARAVENFLFYACIAAVVLATSLVSGWLSRVGVWFMDFFAFGVLALLAALLLYQRVFRYQYEIIGNDLIVTRRYGEHEKHMISVGFDEILDLGDVSKDERIPTLRCCVLTKKLHRKQIVYSKAGKRLKLVLQPSDTLWEKINQHVQEARSAASPEA